MSTRLRIRLFGKLEVQYSETGPIEFSSRKAQELLCYLLLHRDRPHSRERIADALWGEQSSLQSKKYLRQSLWQLQSAFDMYGKMGDQAVVLVEPEWVHLNPQVNLWLDIAEFEEAFLATRAIPGTEINAQESHRLQQGILLYRNHLLDGWYQDWCIYDRERFQSMYLSMLDKLLAYCEQRHEYEAGISYAMQVLHSDRARERTHRTLMRFYYLVGDRTSALRQYESCVAALAEELDVEPAASTRALWEAIRADRPALVAAAEAVAKPTAAPLAQPAPGDALQYLYDVRRSLTGLLVQIEEFLQKAEQENGGR